MSDPFVGEIRIFAGNFAPLDWALCNGAIMAISQNETLFNLIGTTYGGDGQQTFAVPDLRGRVPIHTGSSGASDYVLGQSGGRESVTLTNNQLPAHNHLLPASSASGTSTSPAGNVPAAWGSNQYSDAPPTGAMGAAVQPAGASLPHDNMLPFLGINFIISLFGTFPTQS
jgi:microcystin-dependent protein